MAVTMGDASGVGPEIALRYFANGELANDVVVYGDASILRAGATLLQLDVPIHTVEESSQAIEGSLNVMDLGLLTASDLTPGKLRKDSGAAARAHVERATKDALKEEVAGIVTLPVNKEATRLSDPHFIGHTELIAQLCDVQDYSMMLVTDDVAVSHVSTHVPLAKAIQYVTKHKVRSVIELTHAVLSTYSENPRIAVCGLNPHASENGLFGDEEKQHITPAINETIQAGINASGPYPADTIFHQAIHQNRYDAVICMYHDQGHAPMKLFDFESAVNVTIGLPIIRTSVDHGTAFDRVARDGFYQITRTRAPIRAEACVKTPITLIGVLPYTA